MPDEFALERQLGRPSWPEFCRMMNEAQNEAFRASAGDASLNARLEAANAAWSALLDAYGITSQDYAYAFNHGHWPR